MHGTMKAIQLRRTGGPEVLEYVDLPPPQLFPGQLRVRAHAIGVGKPDVLIRQGIYRWMPPLPAIPGNEMAGEVIEIGEGVPPGWRLGDRVLVSSRELPQRGGCYAQEICVPASAVYRLPDAVAAADAVSLPNYQLAGALLYESGARTPRSIVVHGAAGGVAVALMQLAAAGGILAIGTTSNAAKRDFARRAQALHVIDRSTQDVLAQVQEITGGRGVDMVLDHMGGPDFTGNLELLAPLGTLMSYNVLAGLPQDNLIAQMRAAGAKSPGVRCYTIHTLDSDPGTRRALMQRAIDLAAQGALRPPPPTLLDLSQAAQAHAMLDASEVLGKVVLLPDTR